MDPPAQIEDPSEILDVTNLSYEKDMRNYAEAMRISKPAEWEVAIREEVRAL